MFHRIKLTPLAILALLLTALSLPASAQVLYSSMPWDDSGGPCIGNNGVNATGLAVRTPSDSYYFVERVLLSLHDVGDPSNFDVKIYSDVQGGWDSVVGSFGVLSGPGGSDISDYEFYATAPIILSPDTVYWVVATVPDEASTCAAGWNAYGSAPSGPFSYVDALQFYDGIFNQPDPTITLVILGGPTDAPVMVPVPGLGNWGLLLAILLLAASGGLLIRRYY